MSCGDPHDADCREVLARVFEYLDGEMTADDVARVREHLDECSPCLAEYGLDVALKALVRRSCGREHAPDALRERILTHITHVQVQFGK